MKITSIDAGFMPFVWALSESAKIEAKLEQKPAKPIHPAFGEVHDDAPMRIADILQLPEFRGALSVSTIRVAIASGGLRHERYGRRIVVTPRAVREWREQCLSPAKPAYGSSLLNSTSELAQFESTPSGASKTETAASSLDALQATLRALKKR